MPPRHGQGANQAVEDGVALAVCLAEAGPGGDGIHAVLAATRRCAARTPPVCNWARGTAVDAAPARGCGTRRRACALHLRRRVRTSARTVQCGPIRVWSPFRRLLVWRLRPASCRARWAAL
ncbi:hypothetical protein [Streptomyces sp. NPDC017958]|uniref:hypothetical protein n=1 Tax=Streptomyces sp. NPDC017958 TaxID=3365021 RepID=UPI0037958F77